MKTSAKERLFSLDALRGFDMFWIVGGDMLFRSLGKVTDWQWADWWANQLYHVEWEGFHAYDLIFPLFMFIAGAAIPYALTGKLEKGVSISALHRKVIKRAVILVILGVIYNGALSYEYGLFSFDFSNIRVASVLGQIGLAYLIAGMIVLHTSNFRQRLYWLIGILAGIAAVQHLVPVPGYGAGVLTPEGSINSYIDQQILPGTLYGGTYDPEGLLSIVSAGGITLMGALAGAYLRDKKLGNYRKVVYLASAGVVLVISGSLLGQVYPIIKSAWTSTFNLFAGGLCLVILALFYLIIDVWKIRRWSYFFRVIGMNSITIYVGSELINFKYTSDFVFRGFASFTGNFEPVVLFIAMILLEWLFLYYLYKNRIFLRV